VADQTQKSPSLVKVVLNGMIFWIPGVVGEYLRELERRKDCCGKAK
jgi:hypothetical protein